MSKINILDCMTLVGSVPPKFDGEKTYVSTGALDCDRIDYKATEQVTYAGRPSRANLVAENGDILFAKMCATKKTLRLNQTTREFLFSTGFCAVRANSSVITPELLYYVLSSDQFLSQKDKHSSGATQKAVTNTGLGKIFIQVPALSEQPRIVAILDKLSNLISLRKQELIKLDELVKARFIELFSDIKSEDELINLCAFIDYRGKTPEKTDSGLPFITAKNVKMHYMSFDTQEFISRETYDKVMTRGFPKVGDVVFTTEAPLGNVCRIPHIDTEFYIGQRIITMQTNHLEPTYLEYALASDEFKRKIAKKSSGSTVTGIRSKLLKQLTIPVPPMGQQQQFATFVEQTDKSKLTIQQSLDRLESLEKSLMQQYFG